MLYSFTKNLYLKIKGLSFDSSDSNLSFGIFLISILFFSLLYSISNTNCIDVNLIFSFFKEVVILKSYSIKSNIFLDCSLLKSLILYSKLKIEFLIVFCVLIYKICLSFELLFVNDEDWFGVGVSLFVSFL